VECAQQASVVGSTIRVRQPSMSSSFRHGPCQRAHYRQNAPIEHCGGETVYSPVPGELGDYVLPDGWVVLAAGNPASERGVHFSMPRPLRNRFVHLELEADLNDWSKWAVGERDLCFLIESSYHWTADERESRS